MFFDKDNVCHIGRDLQDGPGEVLGFIVLSYLLAKTKKE